MIRYGQNLNRYIGYKFGLLTVIQGIPTPVKMPVKWECQCVCGNTTYVIRTNFKSTRSCGCLNLNHRSELSERHGHSSKGKRSPTYYSWEAMKKRCYNPKAPRYERYGGRGIIVCDRWLNFDNFLSDMGERPIGRTLDRIDTNGNYELTNCRWATPKEQANNRSNNKNKGV